MKHLRNLMALVIAYITVFAMGTTAFAATSDTATLSDYNVNATISGVKEGNTVNFHRIVDFNLDEDTNGFSYTLATTLPEAYDTIEELAAITSDGYTYTDGSAAKAAADSLAYAIAGETLVPKATINEEAGPEDSVTTSLPAGWYVVTVSGTADTSIIYQNMIINALPVVDSENNTYKAASAVSFEVKHATDTVTKTVPNDESDAESSDDYSVGDTVEGFKIQTTIPNYPSLSKEATFVITDTPVHMSDVLNSVVVKVNGETVVTGEGTFSVVATDATAATGAGFEITFEKAYILAHPGQTVLVTYNAIIDSNAVISDDGETASNTAKITFNPNPNETATVEPDDNTKLYTYGLTVLKYEDGNENKTLTGAKFVLYASDGSTIVREETEVNENGKLTWDGLEAGSYKLVETVAPAGYRLDSTPRDITLNNTTANGDDPLKDGDQAYVLESKVQNTPGSTLPSTGGIGTTIFYVVGAILVVGAGTVLVTRRRMSVSDK
jgi:fimbrial isopeptide formation D2 family protein/LPXTG-motif cell wall-anchored protein